MNRLKVKEQELIFFNLSNKKELKQKLDYVLELLGIDCFEKVSIISFFSNFFTHISSGIKLTLGDKKLYFYIETSEELPCIEGIFMEKERKNKKNFILYRYAVKLASTFILTDSIKKKIQKNSYSIDALLAINSELQKKMEYKFNRLKEIERKAYYDNLTGIFNRNKFNELIDIEISRSIRYKTSLNFAILDIDHFKHVNDNFGHLVGDQVLKQFTSVIAKNIRKTDIFARWGGEEFVLLMPDTNQESAKFVAEKIRSLIELTTFETVGKVTCSIGIASFDASMSYQMLIENADQALYYAKENGRNQIALLSEIKHVQSTT